MSYFRAKIHQSRFWLGSALGKLTADPLARFKGVASKGKEEEGERDRGREEWKENGHRPPTIFFLKVAIGLGSPRNFPLLLVLLLQNL